MSLIKQSSKFDTLSFVRPCHVKPLYGVSAQTIWRWRKSGIFPAPTQISTQTIGWPRSVLDDFFGITK
jgi:predicted DNA-binding transcriptional regulator AlpA